MLQIRLSKGGGAAAEPAGAGGGGSGPSKPAHATEMVTVACPDHLVIADLPVAKALGAAPSPAAPLPVKSLGRRCRRQLGERVHFCVGCDYPIAVYGRLVPCEHVFCLTCARSDSSCYLCDERIQKIQTIKMMEGIYICAAPHCLKSFLKRSEFESHIQETHADLLQPNAEEEVNEVDNANPVKAASTDTHGKQLTQPESSTARAPPRHGVSQTVNSHPQDREDRPRRNQSREQTPMRTPQITPIPFHGRPQQQSSDSQPDNNLPPQAVWHQQPQPQGFDGHGGSHHRRDSDQAMPDRPAAAQESPFREYPPPPHPFPIPNYQVPMFFNQGVNVPPFGFPPLPADGSQHIFHAPIEMPRQEMSGQDQGSVLGFPQLAPGMAGFSENFPQWNNAVFANVQFVPPPVGVMNPQGYMNPIDGHVRAPFLVGEYDRAPEGAPPHPHMLKSELPGGALGLDEGKGILAPIPVQHHLSMTLPPPPPLPPPAVLQQQIHGKFSGPD